MVKINLNKNLYVIIIYILFKNIEICMVIKKY